MITITGSLAFDHIMDFPGNFSDHIMADKIHQINLSFLVNNLSKQRGGNAGNIAYTLALLKIPSSILGTVGTDFTEYNNFLKEVGIDVSGIKASSTNHTSSAFILTVFSDNQISGFYPGAMSENTSISLSGIQTDLVIISPNDPQVMVKFAKECQELKLLFMLDPGMQLPALNPDDLKQMITGAKILIVNDYELSLLKEKTNFSDDDLLNQVEILITTLGEKGSSLQTKDKKIEIGIAKPIEVLDPTGAGDAYRSGFLAGWKNSLELETCGQMGAVASCYTIEKYGTTNHKFTLVEFQTRFKENFGKDLNI